MVNSLYPLIAIELQLFIFKNFHPVRIFQAIKSKHANIKNAKYKNSINSYERK